MSRPSISVKLIAVGSIFSVWAIVNLADAEEVGKVTHLNGPLFATTNSGVKKILAPQSEINAGDTIMTADKTYARIKFVDNGEVTLRPNTNFKVEEFNYDAKKPETGNAFFNLMKGGLRAISGFIGKQTAHRDKYRMTAAAATIGIRGTIYGVNLCQGGSCGSAIPDGVHVDVSKGTVVVSNVSGSQEINAGQFGYVQNANAKPVILPANPGVKFTPPPALSSNAVGKGFGNGITARSGINAKGSCEVQ